MSDSGSGEEGLAGSKYNASSNMEGVDRNEFDSSAKAHHGQTEQELATKMLQIQSKRFYLDVKQNRRGRFIKVAEGNFEPVGPEKIPGTSSQFLSFPTPLERTSNAFIFKCTHIRNIGLIFLFQIGADGRRSQVYLALSTAAEFRDNLSTFSDYYASLGPPNPDNVPEDGKLKSEMMTKDNRRYYLDLKENARGRFLRMQNSFYKITLIEDLTDENLNSTFIAFIKSKLEGKAREALPENVTTIETIKTALRTKIKPDNSKVVAGKIAALQIRNNNYAEFAKQVEELADALERSLVVEGITKANAHEMAVEQTVSQTITRGGPRSQIAIPAQGMIEFRDALTDLLEEFGTNDGGFKGDLPEERHMKVDNKNFYFDIGQNNRGVYMRISEVKSNFRTAITVPEKCWTRFRDIFNDYCEKMKKSSESPSITADNSIMQQQQQQQPQTTSNNSSSK
ncbi:hypothetical protein DOY81_007956 [Sarcophaga bullata]|nr:hypothetical protein DOY81_007956 [Sarcophaga bullata]